MASTQEGASPTEVWFMSQMFGNLSKQTSKFGARSFRLTGPVERMLNIRLIAAISSGRLLVFAEVAWVLTGETLLSDLLDWSSVLFSLEAGFLPLLTTKLMVL